MDDDAPTEYNIVAYSLNHAKDKIRQTLEEYEMFEGEHFNFVESRLRESTKPTCVVFLPGQFGEKVDTTKSCSQCDGRSYYIADAPSGRSYVKTCDYCDRKAPAKWKREEKEWLQYLAAEWNADRGY